VRDGVTLSLSSMILRNGQGDFFAGGVPGGGALFMYRGSSATMDSVAFENNTCQRASGGAIWTAGAMWMKNCTFHSNAADETAGAIFIRDAVVTISSTTFTVNRAGGTFGFGGALSMDRGAALTLENATLADNTVSHSGGAIYTTSASTGALTLISTTFTANLANYGGKLEGRGGAIYFSGVSSLTVTNCNFRSNVGARGGAISCNRNFGGTVIARSTFESNTATGDRGGGGALYVRSCAIAIFNCTFVLNVAVPGSGGAILYTVQLGDILLSLTITGCTFETNSASSDGGAISVKQVPLNERSNLHVGFCGIEDGCMPRMAGVQPFCFALVNASNGSHIFREYSSVFGSPEIRSSRFKKNKAFPMGNTSSASLSSGGAVHLYNTHANLDNCSLTQNEAAYDGGAVYLGGSASVSVSGQSRIMNNQAGGVGDAIHSSSSGGLTFGGGTQINIEGSSSGVSVIYGGLFDTGNSEVTCGVGEQLDMKIGFIAQQSNDWNIDCALLSVNEAGNLSFFHPDCTQIGITPANIADLPLTCKAITPVMTYSSGYLSCAQCEGYSYSLDKGSLLDGHTAYFKCLPCPLGGNCSSAQIRAKPGFWGYAADTQKGHANQSRVANFLPCPFGYCCSERQALTRGCDINTAEACQNNRAHDTPLCGACKPGFSLSMDNKGCVSSTECGDRGKLQNYAALELLTWLCLCTFFLFQGQFTPLMKLLPDALQPKNKYQGAMSSLVFFYQLAAVIIAPHSQGISGSPISILFCIFSSVASTSQLSGWENCQSESGSGSDGVCVVEGNTFIAQQLWRLALPMILFLLLNVVLYGLKGMAKLKVVLFLGLQVLSSTVDTTPEPLMQHFTRDEGESEEAEDEGEGQCDQDQDEQQQFQEEDAYRSDSVLAGYINGYSTVGYGKEGEGEKRGDEWEESVGTSGGAVAGAPTIAPAVVEMLLYCYGDMTATIFKLLRCTPICMLLENSDSSMAMCTRHESVLFHAGHISCGSWQTPFWLCFVILVSLPAIPIIIWAARHVFPPSSTTRALLNFSSRSAVVRALTNTSIGQALARTAAGPYRHGYWHWSAILMAQRLLMVSVAVFATVEATMSVGMLFVTVWFLLVHIYSMPYREAPVNIIQTVEKACLVGLAVFSSVLSVFASVGFDPTGTPLQKLKDSLYLGMSVLLISPPLFWGSMKVHDYWNMHRGSSTYNRTPCLTEGEGGLRPRRGTYATK
jgi:predicted outer membrane repeat protein